MHDNSSMECTSGDAESLLCLMFKMDLGLPCDEFCKAKVPQHYCFKTRNFNAVLFDMVHANVHVARFLLAGLSPQIPRVSP